MSNHSIRGIAWIAWIGFDLEFDNVGRTMCRRQCVCFSSPLCPSSSAHCLPHIVFRASRTSHSLTRSRLNPPARPLPCQKTECEHQPHERRTTEAGTGASACRKCGAETNLRQRPLDED